MGLPHAPLNAGSIGYWTSGFNTKIGGLAAALRERRRVRRRTVHLLRQIEEFLKALYPTRRSGETIMRLSPAAPIADLIIEALKADRDRCDAIDKEIRDAIDAAGEAITLESLFTEPSLPGKRAAALHRLRGNAALYDEPPISQLRRGQANFVRAHDEYVKGYSDRGYTNVRMAALRLRVAQDQFKGLVHAEPAEKKVLKHGPVGDKTKVMRLTEFSTNEQAAIRVFLSDPEKATKLLGGIIERRETSGSKVYSLYAYMLDETQTEAINKWLTAEVKRTFEPASNAEQPMPRPSAVASQSIPSPSIAASGVSVTAREDSFNYWPPNDGGRQANSNDLSELQSRLSDLPLGLRNMLVQDADGHIWLTEAPKASSWKIRFERAIHHPEVQQALCALLDSSIDAR